MIKNGQKVSLEYSVFLEDGTEIDSNVGDSPLIFVFGEHQVFPALEDALKGLRMGDTKEVFLSPEQAYGPVIQEAYREVDLETVPQPYRFEGAVLGVQDPAGGVFPIRVHKIKDKRVVLDFNHPLAGRSLKFNVKVLEIS